MSGPNWVQGGWQSYFQVQLSRLSLYVQYLNIYHSYHTVSNIRYACVLLKVWPNVRGRNDHHASFSLASIATWGSFIISFKDFQKDHVGIPQKQLT